MPNASAAGRGSRPPDMHLGDATRLIRDRAPPPPRPGRRAAGFARRHRSAATCRWRRSFPGSHALRCGNDLIGTSYQEGIAFPAFPPHPPQNPAARLRRMTPDVRVSLRGRWSFFDLPRRMVMTGRRHHQPSTNPRGRASFIPQPALFNSPSATARGRFTDSRTTSRRLTVVVVGCITSRTLRVSACGVNGFSRKLHVRTPEYALLAHIVLRIARYVEHLRLPGATPPTAAPAPGRRAAASPRR